MPKGVEHSDAEWDQFVAWRGGPVVIHDPAGRPRAIVSSKELALFRTHQELASKGLAGRLRKAFKDAGVRPPAESPAEGPALKPLSSAVVRRCVACQDSCWFSQAWVDDRRFDGLCEHCQKKRLDADLAAAEAVAKGPACSKCGRRVVVFTPVSPGMVMLCYDCYRGEPTPIKRDWVKCGKCGRVVLGAVSSPSNDPMVRLCYDCARVPEEPEAPANEPQEVPEHDRKLVCTVCGETAYLTGAPISGPETFVCYECEANQRGQNHEDPEPEPPAAQEPPRKINFREFT